MKFQGGLLSVADWPERCRVVRRGGRCVQHQTPPEGQERTKRLMDNVEHDAALANSEKPPTVVERDYWYVWREWSRHPTAKHTSYEHAMAEAKRLTLTDPRPFKVMHVVAKVSA